MIVILEGPDGAGKTTLARHLAKMYSMDYHHEGPTPEGNPTKYYRDTLRSFRGQDVVIDRFALGERVYGPALRGADRLGNNGWESFMSLCRAMRVPHVFVLPPPAVCLGNWQAKKANELIKDPNLIWQTYARFAYYATLHYTSYVFDYTRTSLFEAGEAIRSHAKGMP